MSMDLIISTATIPADLGGNDKKVALFKVPSGYGGVTLVDAWAHNSATLAGAGTTFTLTLINMGTTGTASSGTIGAAIGSATQWTAYTPQAWTLDGTEKYVDAGEYIGVHYHELNSANNTIVQVGIAYLVGN